MSAAPQDFEGVGVRADAFVLAQGRAVRGDFGMSPTRGSQGLGCPQPESQAKGPREETPAARRRARSSIGMNHDLLRFHR